MGEREHSISKEELLILMRLQPVSIVLCATLALVACGGQSGTSNSSIAPFVYGSISTHGASVVTSNLKVPITLAQFVPCANGGKGETVVLSGNLHMIAHTTINANNAHIMTSFNPQGVSGVGLKTGDKYQGNGVTHQVVNVPVNGSSPNNVTFVNNFRIIGQGPGNNYLVHQNSQITVNANGTITVDKTHLSVVCK
jgi:hypothetical protein